MADNIHQAIAAIYGEVGYVQKESKQGLNYSYASESALIAALRPAMVKHEVYVSAPAMNVLHAETYTTSKGAVMNLVRLLARVRFTHAPSDTHVHVEAIGEGSDSGDKAANKAMTAAYKYALRQTFCIETGDDPDHTPSADQERATNGNGSIDMLALSKAIKAEGIESPKGLIANVTNSDADELEDFGRARKAVMAWAKDNSIDDPYEEILQRAREHVAYHNEKENA